MTSSLDETAGFASGPASGGTASTSPSPLTPRRDTGAATASGGGGVRTKAITLLAIAGVALVLRVFLVVSVHPVCPAEDDLWRSGEIMTYESLQQRVTGTAAQQTGDCVVMVGDPLYTMGQARMIADGQGMSSPILYGLTGRLTPGAARPCP